MKTLVSFSLVFLCGSVSQAVTFGWAAVGNPGNAADSTGFGAVADTYRISNHEVTNDQYTEFLNAVAATDTNGLYNSSMDTDARGGITRSGSSGSFTYAVKSGRDNNPVVYVSFFDAMRFVNWLENGQGSGSTRKRAFTPSARELTKPAAASASFFLPSEDEWYKAAYHDATAGTSATYFDYPTGTDTVPYSDNPNSLNTPDDTNTLNYFADDSLTNGYNGGFAVTGSRKF